MSTKGIAMHRAGQPPIRMVARPETIQRSIEALVCDLEQPGTTYTERQDLRNRIGMLKRKLVEAKCA